MLLSNEINTDYDWLRDPNWPASINLKIIDYLNSENNQANTFFDKHSNEVDEIFRELKARIKEDDWTVPIKKGDYKYYSSIKEGQDYWIHYRKHINSTIEEVLLDENLESKGREFYKVDTLSVSPNAKMLAYSVDLKGSEEYSIFIKDIKSGEIIDMITDKVFGDIVWDADSKGFYYIPTGDNWRAEKVYYHELNSKSDTDNLIYQERDSSFWVSIEKSSSEKFLFINSASGNSNEIYYIDLCDLKFVIKPIIKRKLDQLYSITNHDNDFYILINDKGKNYRLIKTLIDNVQNCVRWVEIISHDSNIYLLNAIAYKDHLVVEKKRLGLVEIEIINIKTLKAFKINFADEIYDSGLIFTTFEAESVRYHYSSFIQPRQIIEYNFNDNIYNILKVQEVPSGFNKDQYVTKRLWASSMDENVKIPISLLFRSDLMNTEGNNPLYLYGYGSYGISRPTNFQTSILSLIDRGFVFAIAHIRGGDELGYEWYESAKFLNKKRTFEDFIACANTLIEQHYTKKGLITICGGSAGGMLVGYCINNEPNLFKTAILHVPFVDVLATMLDESLPLTPHEFHEWGNPKNPIYYEYIKSYSPVDNVKAQNYPNIFITSGLNDPRVTYWEAAKFAHKLRDFKTDDNMFIFKTNMDGGHKGKTSRYDYLKDIAEEYVFILNSYKS